jgi:hypothetical protein
MPANSSEIEARIAAASIAMDTHPCLKAIVTARQFDAPLTDSFGVDKVSYLAILEEGTIRSSQLFKIRLYETI